jgi:GNAT superfamily N-acetyltransferase
VSEVAFRKAERADVPAIVRLLADDPLGSTREAYDDPLPEPYFAGFDAVDRDPNQLLIVGDRQGEVIATAQLTLLPGLSRQGAWRAQIEAVRVDAAERGRGTGESLIRWLIELARLQGCAVVQLTSDKSRVDAHRFYERLGFVSSHVGMKLQL